MTQRLPPSLSSLDTALAALLDGLAPVAPAAAPLAEAIGSAAAGTPPLGAYPPRDVAATDGWALRANDLVGASSYSPLPLTTTPPWVEAGDVMPEGCDCVLDIDAVDVTGPLGQVLAEGLPGQGVRRAGSDLTERASVGAEGALIGPADLMLARIAGLERLNVRRPRLRLVNVPGATITKQMLADLAQEAGLQVHVVEARGRDEASIADELDAAACDLVVIIGGSGVGRSDAAVTALARRGDVRAHGLALQPGRTAAVGRLGQVPVVALPGSPDHALAAWLALVLPVIDRLSARRPRRSAILPLARKIASGVGVAEITLLAEQQGAWLPLAVGEWPLHAIAAADAWLLVPGSSEGFAAGTPVDAYLMRE